MKFNNIMALSAAVLLFITNAQSQTWNIPAAGTTNAGYIGTSTGDFRLFSNNFERLNIQDANNGTLRLNASNFSFGYANPITSTSATSVSMNWHQGSAMYFRALPDITNPAAGYATRLFLSNGLSGNNYVSVPGKLSIGVGEGNYFTSPTNALQVTGAGYFSTKLGVGINPTSGTSTLDVRASSLPSFNLGTVNGTLSLNFGLATCVACFSNSAQVNDAVISSDVNTGNLLLQSKSPGKSIKFVTAYSDGGFQGVKMEVKHDGKVVIGDPVNGTPNGYRLFVTEGILTDKVKVALNNSNQWSDFVFEENYALPSLDSVEAFIKENKHLPGVPSADDVVSNGLDLASMDAKLLQKVEELTLYMIELQKKNEELEKQIQLLQQKK